jgi:HAD superfamily hydrolase (TIGR01509 family)
MKKLIIFDFDGVIVQSEESRLKIFKKIIINNGISVSDDVLFRLVGKTGKSFIDEYLNNTGQEVRDKILEDYKREYLDQVDRFIEPVDVTLDFIKNYRGNLKMAIATMNNREILESTLQRFGVKNLFHLLITRNDVLKHKPDPEIYIKTARRLKVKPSECIVVEDTKIGAEAAIGANMDCYILMNGFNNTFDFRDINISGFISTKEDFQRCLV